MGEAEPTVSTHVLDVERGRPAEGLRVLLYRRDGTGERLVGEGITDTDGRIPRLLTGSLVAGDYRLVFELAGAGVQAEGEAQPFFTRTSVELRVTDAARSYHVPLLLAPYALTMYRGS